MRLTIVAQNLSHGGVYDGDGEPEDRMQALADRIHSAGADLALLSECQGWDRDDHGPLRRMERLTGLKAAPLAPSGTGYHTGLLYRPSTVGEPTHRDVKRSHLTVNGFAVVGFDGKRFGLPQPLAVVSVHLAPHDHQVATAEMGLAATRGYRLGSYAVLGGDWNFAPVRGTDPDYSQMLPHNIGIRTYRVDPADPDAPRAPHRSVGIKLEDMGYRDAALYLHEHPRDGGRGDPALLAYTAAGERLDGIAVTKRLAGALLSYWRLAEPAGASDHDGVAVTLETELIDTSHPEPFR